MQNDFHLLLPSAKAGNQPAIELILQGLGPLITRQAGNWQGSFRGLDAGDLAQEARLTVLEAIRTYDAARGVPFPLWAQRLIQQRYADLLEAEKRHKRGRGVHHQPLEEDAGDYDTMPYPLPSVPSHEDEVVDRLEYEGWLGGLAEIDRRVAVLTAAGWSKAEVAAELQISDYKVRASRRRIATALRKRGDD